MTYVWLNEEWKTNENAAVRLGQIARMEPEDIALLNMTITPHRLANGMRYVTQFDVAQTLMHRCPELQIQLLGAKRCWIGKKEPKRQKKWMHAALTALAAVVIFAASFFTIMNFHADVAMTDVHEKLFSIFSDGQGNVQLWVGLPYSIGVVLGALLFVLPRGKNARIPDPMEVQNAIYENEVKQYMRSGAQE